MMIRCPWCGDDELYVKYHDEEWGVPVHDDKKHFEFLVLESAQAGLSWITILRKRESYRLVGKLDANPLKHNISIDSPIGRALLGKGLGDKVSIETPDGNMEIEILDIL